ncbi:SPOR domain-containing protein, partial [Bosea vestrisii]
NGGFAVQLGAPGSEAEARATFAALQRKYPGQLSGQSPIVRKTELNGKTVYRLRVGPYSREDASSMCSALQAAGGQCFIAKN